MHNSTCMHAAAARMDGREGSSHACRCRPGRRNGRETEEGLESRQFGMESHNQTGIATNGERGEGVHSSGPPHPAAVSTHPTQFSQCVSVTKREGGNRQCLIGEWGREEYCGQFHKNMDSRNSSTQAFGNPDSQNFFWEFWFSEFSNWRIPASNVQFHKIRIPESFSWRIAVILVQLHKKANPDSQILELKHCGNPYFYGIDRCAIPLFHCRCNRNTAD